MDIIALSAWTTSAGTLIWLVLAFCWRFENRRRVLSRPSASPESSDTPSALNAETRIASFRRGARSTTPVDDARRALGACAVLLGVASIAGALFVWLASPRVLLESPILSIPFSFSHSKLVFVVLVFCALWMFPVTALLWRQPARALLVRPFHSAQISDELKRFVVSNAEGIGHVYTLADEHLRHVRRRFWYPLSWTLFVLFRPLGFVGFRPVVRDERDVFQLLRRISRLYVQNYRWLLRARSVFVVRCSDAIWLRCVQALALSADVILAEVSNGGAGIERELSLLAALGLQERVVLICTPNSRAVARGWIDRHIPTYASSPIHVYGSSVGTSSERELVDRLSTACQSRLRSEGVVERRGAERAMRSGEFLLVAAHIVLIASILTAIVGGDTSPTRGRSVVNTISNGSAGEPLEMTLQGLVKMVDPALRLDCGAIEIQQLQLPVVTPCLLARQFCSDRLVVEVGAMAFVSEEDCKSHYRGFHDAARKRADQCGADTAACLHLPMLSLAFDHEWVSYDETGAAYYSRIHADCAQTQLDWVSFRARMEPVVAHAGEWTHPGHYLAYGETWIVCSPEIGMRTGHANGWFSRLAAYEALHRLAQQAAQ